MTAFTDWLRERNREDRESLYRRIDNAREQRRQEQRDTINMSNSDPAHFSHDREDDGWRDLGETRSGTARGEADPSLVDYITRTVNNSGWQGEIVDSYRTIDDQRDAWRSTLGSWRPSSFTRPSTTRQPTSHYLVAEKDGVEVARIDMLRDPNDSLAYVTRSCTRIPAGSKLSWRAVESDL